MEVWKSVLGYKGIYEVSDRGRVRSVDRVIDGGRGGRRNQPGCAMATTLDLWGYPRLGLNRDGGTSTRSVHSLVLEAFVGPRPDGLECAHENGVKTDNRPENLRWATRTENEGDKVGHGTDPIGERHGRAKLTERHVRRIRFLRSRGRSAASLASEYGVTHASINQAVSGQTWSHVEKEP